MKYIFTRAFWGIIIVLMGILIILDNFGIDIHFSKFFWPALLIFIGLSMLFKPSRKNCCEGDIIMNDAVSKAMNGKKDYSVIFGQGEFDFTDMNPEKDEKFEVNVIFGKGTLKVKKGAAYRINSTSVFGEVTLPDGKSTAFSERVFETKNSKDEKVLNIEANAIFGSLKIVEV